MEAKNVRELIEKLRKIRQEEISIGCELANLVSEDQAVLKALTVGLVRLNFKAPSGFISFLQKQKI